MDELRIGEVMAKDVVWVEPDAPLEQAIANMSDHRYSCVLVCEDRCPIGIITERDVAQILAGVLESGRVPELSAEDVMSTPVVTISSDARLSFAISEVKARRIRRLVVINAEGALVGLVTQTDLLRAYTRELEASRSLLESKVVERTRQLAEANRTLETSSRLKSDFLGFMSHEIRTPLSGVVGMADLLLETDLDDTQRDYIETVNSSAQSLLAIINDVLDISKLEAGKMGIQSVPLDLKATIKDVMALLKPQAAKAGNELQLRWPRGVPAVVSGDPVRIRQVLINLIGNAIKFTNDGQIDVQVKKDSRRSVEGMVRIAVEDTGAGIARDRLEILFAPFEQGEAGRARSDGTGLGLYISKKLVELMGGEIGVESRTGEGSTFWMRLPLPFAEDLPLARRRSRRETTPPRTFEADLLVAEDDRVSRKVLVHMLQRLGCRVDAAENGRRAMELLENEPYDLVLMDCKMPELDGLQATGKLRHQEGHGALVPIVAISASNMEDDRERCINAGMDDYLVKPVRSEDLRRLLERWLGDR